MDTYKTLDAARAAKGHVASYILQIEHRDAGICYIGCKVPARLMRTALEAKPMAEIVRVIDDYPAVKHTPTPTQDQHTCERCGAVVDSDAYHQTERSIFGGSSVRVTAYYCAGCHQLLTQIGAGEYTAMQDRAGDRPDNTTYSKED